MNIKSTFLKFKNKFKISNIRSSYHKLGIFIDTQCQNFESLRLVLFDVRFIFKSFISSQNIIYANLKF